MISKMRYLNPNQIMQQSHAHFDKTHCGDVNVLMYGDIRPQYNHLDQYYSNFFPFVNSCFQVSIIICMHPKHMIAREAI